MVITYAILVLLLVNTTLRVKTYRIEQRRKRLAQKRWDAIQQHANQLGDSPLVWS